MSRFGRRVLHAGLVVEAAGLLAIYAVLRAAEWTALATAGLLACSFVVAFGLPRRAREQGAQGELQ